MLCLNKNNITVFESIQLYLVIWLTDKVVTGDFAWKTWGLGSLNSQVAQG